MVIIGLVSSTSARWLMIILNRRVYLLEVGIDLTVTLLSRLFHLIIKGGLDQSFEAVSIPRTLKPFLTGKQLLRSSLSHRRPTGTDALQPF